MEKHDRKSNTKKTFYGSQNVLKCTLKNIAKGTVVCKESQNSSVDKKRVSKKSANNIDTSAVNMKNFAETMNRLLDRAVNS
jgi:hypothetical protein